MNNRDMVKWQPFCALVPGNTLVNKILNEKNKVKMPLLSEEQLKRNEELVLESFTNQEYFHFYYFSNGNIKEKYAFVKEIDNVYKKLLLNDNTYIFFKQIVKLSC